MAEVMSDEQLATLRIVVREPSLTAPTRAEVAALIAEVDRLRAVLARVTGDEMVQYLARAAHAEVCRAPGGVDECYGGHGAWVYDAEKTVELIDELTQEEEQDDAQQRSEQAEEVGRARVVPLNIQKGMYQPEPGADRG